jgi:predicted adenylyl cyclase CyaB
MRTEREIKVKGFLSENSLIKKGGELLGKTIQQDTYFLFEEKVIRVREEGESLILTEKGKDHGLLIREKEVSESNITKKDFDKLKKECKNQILLCKTRSIFSLKGVLIVVDDVEHLGYFVEVKGASTKKIMDTLKLLGFENSVIIKESYFDLMLNEKVPSWIHCILRLHEKIGELSFGITSGILTTLGLMIGVNAATTSVLPVIASIATISVADSCSDSFGMYMSKAAERGVSTGEAIRYASGTLIGKFLFPLTFIVPILIFGLNVGIIVDIGWGIFSLALLSAEQAIVEQDSIAKKVLKNTLLAIAIIVLSFIVGSLVSGLVNI